MTTLRHRSHDMTDKLREDEAAREEAVCSCGAGHGSLEGHTDWCDYEPALAAAPQPAPVDREALAKIVQDAMIRTGVRWDDGSSEAIADALLARGLRLQGAEETMAWAVVRKGGGLLPGNTFANRDAAERFASPHGRVDRVAIRVVGGGDDE